MAHAAKPAGRVGLLLCACTAVSVYNSLGSAASITPACCDPGGKAQREQPVRGGCIHTAACLSGDCYTCQHSIFWETAVKYEAPHPLTVTHVRILEYATGLMTFTVFNCYLLLTYVLDFIWFLTGFFFNTPLNLSKLPIWFNTMMKWKL